MENWKYHEISRKCRHLAQVLASASESAMQFLHGAACPSFMPSPYTFPCLLHCFSLFHLLFSCHMFDWDVLILVLFPSLGFFTVSQFC